MYYRTGKDAGGSARAWVMRLFAGSNRRVAGLKGGAQLIPTDPAEVDRSRFATSAISGP
jgi:hypothetical protein